MHFAAEWIEAAKIAGAVGKQGYGVFANLEQPWLGVMRVGRQDRGAQGPTDAIVSISLPVLPGPISHTIAARPDAAIPGAKAKAAQNESGGAPGQQRAPVISHT